jgi:ABC-type multidrug transport system permease subunit
VKRILDIGHNELRLFFKSRTAYIWLFLLPTAMVYFLGAVARGPDDPYNHRAPVAIDNLDTNFLSRAFLGALTNQGIKTVGLTNAPRGIRIPHDFSQRLLAGHPAQVALFGKTDGADADAMLLNLRLTRALIQINSDLFQAAAGTGGLTGLTENKLRRITAEPDATKLHAYFAGRKPTPTGYNFSLPGNLVMYLFMNVLIFGGSSTATGRRNGTFRRLATTPATRLEIVLGKIYGNTLLGAAQIAFFLLLGRFLFHVNFGSNLPGVLLILIALAWAAAALGVLAGSCITSEDRVIPVCVMVALVAGGVGGCWWPLETAPPLFKHLALSVPSGWALAGLHQMISFGSGLHAAIVPAAVLLGFGLLANLFAIRFFRV